MKAILAALCLIMFASIGHTEAVSQPVVGICTIEQGNFSGCSGTSAWAVFRNGTLLQCFNYDSTKSDGQVAKSRAAGTAGVLDNRNACVYIGSQNN